MSNAEIKAALNAQLREVRDKLNSIEESERDAERAAVIGKCFRYHNSYGEGYGDPWWLYCRPYREKDGEYRLLSFQTDNDGRIEIKCEGGWYAHLLTGGYEEIPASLFDAEWAATIARATTARVLAGGEGGA